ncbi:rhomboid family intramembrane serine protease [Microbaculum marinisediminis]|uniref:Rhomboid family intramembrane serine protease n=1 Tax=Microbaculum marinisediminis TaxID=2931392 RepID=A0AAW5R3Y2_9HYPH|nr:rhomboid family intramembrane serine protease [Microbaculum sp. A6E488]MCT8974529.1 rhomboid family intramembrane serine protease [Microbaculum sp. A6E488]
MFVPISDNNPLRHLPFQYVTVALIVVNVFVYVVFVSGLFADALETTAYTFGLIPAVFNDYRELPAQYAVVPESFTLLTYQFVHGGFLHLASNMLFLWVFGDNVEDAMGHWRFLTFYLLCGVAAALVHDFAQPQSVAPLVGASGAVSGVIAAYLMLHPNVKVWVLVLWRVPLRLKAAWVLGFWVVLQVFSVLTAAENESVAWWAHIGGLAAGAVLVVFMRRRGVPLFDRGLVTAVPPSRS